MKEDRAGFYAFQAILQLFDTGKSLDEIRDFFNILGVMKKMCFPNPNGGRGCSKNNVKV